ncbi:Predicted arabinose efflux permease, MFS family [Pedobacter sp. ok626]|uniref:MFS transporter n=1 Tax=Pedobacter sp. ok626 TaxID=1761882 RepID=UPI00088DF754|nr:MFS transporter [Pedobacter sp. ok626]SDL70618.1 Predicted arabinose efflux permease, MFS family [Pedobacter sp. ok626]
MEQSTKPIAEPFSSYQILVIALLALLQFTIVLDFMVLAPLGDFLMKSLSMTPKGFGLVVSSYAFSAGASGILAAGFADKFDRKKLLLFFYTGFIVGTLCCALSTNYEMLLGARIVTGLFGGVIGAISMTIVTDIFAVHQRGRVMGVVQMGFAASQVLGIPIGLYLANIWGWHSSFLMIVILAIMIAITILFMMKPIDKHLALQSDKSPFLHLWHALSNRSYQLGFIATAFMSVGGFMLMPFGSAYLINNINITQQELPMVFMFTGLASIVIMPLVGKLSDKVDKFMLFTGGSVLAIILILIYTNLGPIPLWQVVVVNMVLFMGIMSRMIPATTLTMSVPDIKDRGAFMSVNASLQQMAGGIAALSAGLIVTQETKSSPLENYDILGIVVSVMIVVCIFFVYKVSELVKAK